jgi:hypothetical protein
MVESGTVDADDLSAHGADHPDVLHLLPGKEKTGRGWRIRESEVAELRLRFL